MKVVLTLSSRGRILGSNEGTIDLIAKDLSGTTPYHLVDDGSGIVSDLCDASGNLIATTTSTNPSLDTAVVQYLAGAEPTEGGHRLPIRGEAVYKSRTIHSFPSVGTIDFRNREEVRIVNVDHAHSGDSGQLWFAVSDGAAVAVHLEGHDLSQGSAKGAPINQTAFEGGLGPPKI